MHYEIGHAENYNIFGITDRLVECSDVQNVVFAVSVHLGNLQTNFALTENAQRSLFISVPRLTSLVTNAQDI